MRLHARAERVFALLIGALCLLQFAPAAAADGAKTPPNFVFILGEGHGWTSTSVQMNDALSNSKSNLAFTPALDRIAREGMRFSYAYAALPRCTPSRAAIFTGKNPALMHMTFIGEGKKDGGVADNSLRMIPPQCVLELPHSETTIGGLLKSAGYATAHFGKWHCGRISPREYGFDETDGANANRGPENVDSPNPKQAFALTQLGLDFMARQVKAGKPFYVQMSHYAGKSDEDARPETLEAVRKRAGVTKGDPREDKVVGSTAVMEDMDATIGMILKKIDELGIAGNTFVIYSADHGTPGRNSPLSGGKGTLWEGGIRVPLIVRGPGVKAGACSPVQVANFDLLPTLAELAKVKTALPANLEGGSFASALLNGGGGAVRRAREGLIFHYPHYDHDNEGPSSAIILGTYKLIKVYETDSVHLYDISKDSAEQHDLAKEMPDKVTDLSRRLTDALTGMNVQMAAKNPNFDPAKAGDGARKRKNKKDGQ